MRRLKLFILAIFKLLLFLNILGLLGMIALKILSPDWNQLIAFSYIQIGIVVVLQSLLCMYISYWSDKIDFDYSGRFRDWITAQLFFLTQFKLKRVKND